MPISGWASPPPNTTLNCVGLHTRESCLGRCPWVVDGETGTLRARRGIPFRAVAVEPSGFQGPSGLPNTIYLRKGTPLPLFPFST